jgi:hypothetical protein
LRHGDSLVGLSRRQIEAFHWDPSQTPALKGLGLREAVDKVFAIRSHIREAGEAVSDRELRDLWDEAQFELAKVRIVGDLAIAAFFEADKPRERERRRAEFADAVVQGRAEDYHSWLEQRRIADPPLAPFHWEIEFPEVFVRENPGFDAFVGNPPFAGKNSVAGSNVRGYLDWLKESHEESHGNADLVAHFFRRAFDLLRSSGAFGFIATNTIAQGDTRSTGLRWICTHAGEIFAVRKRVKWPGMAAVVVSVAHVMKGHFAGTKLLDGRAVDTITAFLFYRGGDHDPARLRANAGKSFVGSYVLGMGFTFDDTDRTGAATPIVEMERLLATHPDYRKVLFPYIGGEEVNDRPTHAHHRYAINFFDRSEQECRRLWPELMSILEAKVKPKRIVDNRESYRRLWWQYAEKRAELTTAIVGLPRVLVISRVGQQAAFTFLPNGLVFSEALIVFPLSSHAAFCGLQARPHEIWARFFGSSMKDDLRYTPSDCFETFPFPEHWESHPALEAAGKHYYDFRAALMVRNDQGLTKTYNRFHDPDERDAEILKLRDLHTAMDRAVLDAYSWRDLVPTCEFLLDYDIDEEEWGDKKKPYRYRWSDDVQAEVLARLLELNAERARTEVRDGFTKEKKGRTRSPRPGKTKAKNGDLLA